MAEFVKMSELVGKEFTVNKVNGYKFKMWDAVAKQMLTSDTYLEGHRKVYAVETDKGALDVSASQLANMLEGVSKEGRSDINGWTFHVKSNGKTGIDIRYYLNPKSPPQTEDTLDEEPLTMEDF